VSISASSVNGIDRGAIRVRVSAPETLPTDGPVFFNVEVRSAALPGRVQTVSRRFKAFDGLVGRLHWDRVGWTIGAPDLPPKFPAPGYNAVALADRAEGLQLWAAFILSQPEALKHPDVCVFFGLPADLDPDEVAAAETALLKMQAVSRGFLARASSAGVDASSRSLLGDGSSSSGSTLRAVLVLSLLCAIVAALTAAILMPTVQWSPAFQHTHPWAAALAPAAEAAPVPTPKANFLLKAARLLKIGK